MRRLRLLAPVFESALARMQACHRLAERSAFERLISRLVRTFVNATPSEMDERIREGLARLVDLLGVDEAFLGRVSEDGELVVACRVPHGETTGDAPLPYLAALRRHQIVVVRSAHDVAFLPLDSAEATPSGAGPADASRRSPARRSRTTVDLGVASAILAGTPQVSVPLVLEGRLWGTITVAASRRFLAWPVREIGQLRLVGEIIMEAVGRREIEEKMRRQRDELTQVTQIAALGELTGALAHELNQPLTAIRMNAQTTRRLLAADPGPDELGEIFADIAGDATRAGQLIVRLRSLLRRRELEKVCLSLNHVIEDARPAADAEARRRGAGLALALAPGLPTIRGDALQLRQVLLNLVRNAAEAMADGGGDPRVVVRTYASTPEHVTVSVEDTGPRIDDSIFAKMFVAFHTTKPEGLGMGLAICQSIVEAHGGQLWAARRPETGMAVRFSLPAARSDA